MASGIMGNSIWHLVRESDVMTWIVLLVLLALSIICWTVFLYKFLVLRIKRDNQIVLLQKMRELNSVEQCYGIIVIIEYRFAKLLSCAKCNLHKIIACIARRWTTC